LVFARIDAGDASGRGIRSNNGLERSLASRNDKASALEPLLPRVAQGDAGAVREFIDRYGALVWSLVRESTRDPSQAEDAVQEIFISIWKAAERFDPERGSETVFLTTIARRRLIDRFRRRSRGPDIEPLDEVVAAEDDAGLRRVELDDEASPAFAALRQLEPQQKRLIELWVVGGMTHSEIATSTGTPLGTVKTKIRRGLIRLRELLNAPPASERMEVSA
jgi:RNA polymerase sigma-70 factor (ECF subfamily)